MNIISRIKASAHCDIPCGIYEPIPAKIAARTVFKMVSQLKTFDMPKDAKDKTAALQYLNSVSRRITVKEEHAQLCKKELYILWSDFFKPPHIEKHPELHDLFWQAAKLCSKNKQEINEDAARDLIDHVDKIARIFYEVENAPEKYNAYKELTDRL